VGTVAPVFDELLAHPGVEERWELRSTVGFLAFHGGSLEMNTDVIAAAAAERAGASLYAVIQPAGFRWHIPSRLVDPACSIGLTAFLEHVDVAIALHGFGRPTMFTTVLVGGGNRVLAAHVAGHLRVGLPEYEVRDEIDAIPGELRGLHPDNPANRPRGGGVQLELPPRVRGLGPFWADHDPATRPAHAEALIAALVAAATTWPEVAPPP
jgi:phage replication-related protein YjqB (UPF0714/DUF867 family)